jgi:DNA-binding MarR family transcriptional regulator
MEKERTKGEFTQNEKRVLTALYNAYKHLPTERIADVSGMSRVTAKKYLEELEAKGKVESKRVGKSIYWWIKVKERMRA